MKNQQARKQRLTVRDKIDREEERKLREEEEDYLRSENLGVDSVLQNYDDNRFDQKQKFKKDTRPKIRKLFTFNLGK